MWGKFWQESGQSILGGKSAHDRCISRSSVSRICLAIWAFPPVARSSNQMNEFICWKVFSSHTTGDRDPDVWAIRKTQIPTKIEDTHFDTTGPTSLTPIPGFLMVESWQFAILHPRAERQKATKSPELDDRVLSLNESESECGASKKHHDRCFCMFS